MCGPTAGVVKRYSIGLGVNGSSQNAAISVVISDTLSQWVCGGATPNVDNDYPHASKVHDMLDYTPRGWPKKNGATLLYSF